MTTPSSPRQLNRVYRAGVVGAAGVCLLGAAIASAGSANDAKAPGVSFSQPLSGAVPPLAGGPLSVTPLPGAVATSTTAPTTARQPGQVTASTASTTSTTSATKPGPLGAAAGVPAGTAPAATGSGATQNAPGVTSKGSGSATGRPTTRRPATGPATGTRPISGGGTAPPVAAAPPAQVQAQTAASDQGVYVDLGFIILPSSQYTQYGATDQQEDLAIHAIVDDVNAHGGLNGRRINPIIVGDTNPLSANGGTAACNSLVNGSKVFMVIDEALPGGPDCVAHAGRPVLDTGYSSEDNATKAQLEQDSPYYWITGEVTDNMVTQWLQFAAKDPSLGTGQRYAITVAAAHPGFKAASDLLQQLGPQYGINIVTTFVASDDTSTAQLQCQQGINQFKQNNVTAEFPVDNPVAIGFGMNCSQGQNTTASGAKIKYTLSSIGAMDSTSGSSLYTNDFDGTRGISQNHIPSSPTNSHCRAVIEAKGIPFTTIQANYCETIGVASEVFRRIPTNQPVTASTWINQIANLRGYTGNAQDVLNFSPDKHWGSDGVLVYQYHGGANGTTTEESAFKRNFE